MIIKSYKAVASKLELQNAHCDMFHALVLFQTCWGLCQRPVSLKRVCRTSSDCRTRGLEFVPAHSPLGRGKLESLNWLSIELVQQDYAQVISTKHQVSALLTLRQADRRCLQKNQRTLVPLHDNHLTLSQRSLGRNQPLTGHSSDWSWLAGLHPFQINPFRGKHWQKGLTANHPVSMVDWRPIVEKALAFSRHHGAQAQQFCGLWARHYVKWFLPYWGTDWQSLQPPGKTSSTVYA